MRTPIKENYITRLICCGYPCVCALKIYKLFSDRKGGMEELEHFLAKLEKNYVD